jgi:adenosine kinase
MTALICGSLAFDTVMVFEGRFKDHILADRIHILNVSFLVPSLKRNYGGCAGNIAYNLRLLGDAVAPMGTVGDDFSPYLAWLLEQGVDTRSIRVLPGSYTAQAFITTDLDDNQITAFHPGAMSRSELSSVPVDAGIRFGVIAPDGRNGMIEHAAQFSAADIPWLFDPGQGLPMFDGAELRAFVAGASWVAVNDYEGEMLKERTGLSYAQIAAQVRALIVTRGAQGSLIYADGREYSIPVAPVAAVVDPTGCGDAYRAGLIHGLLRDLDWETTGRIAALMGAFKVERHGTQNHRFSRDQFVERYRAAFDRPLSLPETS